MRLPLPRIRSRICNRAISSASRASNFLKRLETRTPVHTYRTHTCGELRSSHVGSVVRLSGWLRNRRDHGGVYFIDLADHYGTTQLVVAPESEMYERVTRLPKETFVRADGTVLRREEGKVHPAMQTGEVHIRVSQIEVRGPTEPLPFNVFPETA